MNRMRGTGIYGVAALLLAAGLAASAGAQDAGPRAETPLSRQISLDVRAADVGEVLARLSGALPVRMEADPGIGGRRITVYTRKTTVYGFQQALAGLMHTSWRLSEEGAGEGRGARYRLLNNTRLQEAAARLRLQRRTTFLARLFETSDALRRRDPEAVAAALRAGVARRLPELPEESLGEITPEFLGQTLLLAPLRNGLSRRLAETGGAWAPFYNLPPRTQQFFADFMVGQYRTALGNLPAEVTGALESGQPPLGVPQPGAPQAPSGRTELAGPLVLNTPQARVEYRLLYGDRWTGALVYTRLGAGDTWAQATLPSALYDLPDDATLYPEAATRPMGRELFGRVDVKIDPATQNWDQALAALARAGKLNVLSDSFPRPDLFRPGGKSPVLTGKTLGELLDRVTQYYGYAWWKQGDWYLFRNRFWAEEERVAVPQAILQSMGASIAASGSLSPENLAALAALTDEQLLTLNVWGNAAGRTTAPPESFDYQEVQVARAGLLLLRQVTPAQRDLVRGAGLPYSRMNPVQRFVFATVASDRNIPLNPFEQARWSFRVTDQFRRERLPAGAAEVGSLQLSFNYGSGGGRQTELAIRVPAVPRPEPKETPAAAPSGDNPPASPE